MPPQQIQFAEIETVFHPQPVFGSSLLQWLGEKLESKYYNETNTYLSTTPAGHKLLDHETLNLK